MAKTKKIAMVAPVPAKPKMFSLEEILAKQGNDRPYIVIFDKPDHWLVHFIGDNKPTKINK